MKHILIVGLGNPGKEFEGTRHNLGIDAVRAWVGDAHKNGIPARDWRTDQKNHAEIAIVSLPEAKVTCLFPLTFMNDSGKAVAEYMRNSSLSAADIIVVHDELELALGEVVLQNDGSARGHNGLRSIFDHLGTQDMARLRLGIGRPNEGTEVSDFVLRKFSKDELTTIHDTTIPVAVEKLSGFVGEQLATL